LLTGWGADPRVRAWALILEVVAMMTMAPAVADELVPVAHPLFTAHGLHLCSARRVDIESFRGDMSRGRAPGVSSQECDRRAGHVPLILRVAAGG
jgi:hypothetical protein